MPVLVIVGWVLGWGLLWRMPRLERAPVAPEDDLRVSVVIPARNEADRLPDLLASLRAQTRPPDEVVVVDDQSSDSTAAVAASSPGTVVVSTPPLPTGWSGKPWACTAGVAASQGDVLVFLDADVTLAPEALASLLTTWRQSTGLVSVQPHHVIKRAREVVSLPFNIVAMMGMGIGSLIPPRSSWAAAGPCLVTSRADYDSVGGHAAVRGEIAEDLALARRYTDAGLPVRCVGGRDLVQFRMYRTVGDAVEGWHKNLASGARHTPRIRAVATATWVTGLLVAAHLLLGLTGPSAVAVPAVVAYVMVAIQVGAMGRQVGRFGVGALAWPVLMIGFVAVFAWSAVSTFVTRRVRWSGRTVQLRLPR